MNYCEMTDTELKKRIKRYYMDEHFGFRDRASALAELLAESSRRLDRSYSGTISIFDTAINDAVKEIADLDAAAFSRRASARPSSSGASAAVAIADRNDCPKNYEVFRISGDSMIGAGISDGDSVVVELATQGASINSFDGKIVVAEVCGVSFVKRLSAGSDGTLLLVSENSKYPPYELKTTDTLRLIGEVKQIIHNI